ncbi:MAG: TonB-dependent receptor [Opitutaceae bacterium]|jgi:TonB-dependent receptor|nr:TonB-dependent receptor [Opitutaceae bacterium]
MPTPPSHYARAALTLATRLLTIVAALSVARAQTPAPAATGNIAGRVYDASSDQFVRNAEISVEGTAVASVSEDGGHYRLDNLPAGRTALILRYSGRQTRSFTVEVPPGGTVEFEMELGADDTTGRQAKKDEDIVLLERFVVSGEREGNAKAYMEQKRSMSMKNVVSSDLFGDIADGNVAEFLKYMPGITTGAEDSRVVRIRGLDPKYVGVTMDGNRLASSASGSIDNIGQYEFEQLSLTSIESVEVNKVLTAELEADALAGIINVRTKSPLDQKRMHLAWSLKLSGNSYDLSLDKEPGFGDQHMRKVLPGGQIGFTDNYFGQKLGISISASRSDYLAHYERLRQYYDYGTTGLAPPYTNDIRIYDQDNRNIRDALDLGIDFQATRNLRFQLRANYASINVEMHQYTTRFFISGAPSPDTTPIYIRPADGAGALQLGDGLSRTKKGATSTIMPGFTYKRGGLTLDGRFGYSKSYNDYDNLGHGYFRGATAYMSGLTFGATRSDADSTAWNIVVDRDVGNPANFVAYRRGVESARSHAEQEIYSGALNLKWLMPWSVPAFLKAGVSYRAMIHRITQRSAAYTFVGPDGVQYTADDNYLDWVSPRPFNNHFGINIYNTDGTPVALRMPSRTRLAEIFREHSPGGADPWFTEDQYAQYEDWFLNRVNYWEEIPAAYVMGNTKLGRLQVQAGLRWEHTGQHINTLPMPYTDAEMVALGLPVSPQDETYWHVKYKGGKREWRTIDRDDFFASASARWAFTPNLLLRAGFAQALHRPGVRQLWDLSDLDETEIDNEQNVDNLDLRPEYSNNYSVELEYYFEPSGKLAASVFCNDIKDVIYRRGWVTWNEDDELKYRSRWDNGGRLTMRGFELEYSQAYTFLPGFLRHTGLFANYTQVFFDRGNMEKEKLAGGTAPRSASGGIWFDNRRLSVRLKSVWTDETFVQTYQFPDEGPADYYYDTRRREPFITFDLDVEYKLKFKGSRIQPAFFITGRNILNESRRIYSNERGRLFDEYLLGAMWTAGIKGSF